MATRNGTSNTIGSSVDDRIEGIKDSVKNLVEQGEEKASAIKERVIEVKDQAMDRGNALLDKSTDYIKENPLKSVAIAFGIGYFAMRIFR
ncbi:MAG: YqjD family protein [Kofleriaceae bacterium]